MRYEVTINFGPGNRIVRSFDAGTTIGQALDDPGVQQALGYPNNVKPLINRVEQSRNTALSSGDVIHLETVGTQKA